IYEALASGTPVIAAAEGGMRELVKEYAGGWLVPRGDAQALADTMARLAADPAEVRRVAAGIRPVPSLAGHVAALGAVYAEALAGGGRHG
ncbi:MAG: glycosyltransferase family 4 protein, partial [Chloroflexi bacterium]|nr:glycosyltransferase family 4 protein [Chloroflexota bacterium]